MAGRANPEIYLRLACERLASSARRYGGMQLDTEVLAIGRALIAARLMEEEQVRSVLGDVFEPLKPEVVFSSPPGLVPQAADHVRLTVRRVAAPSLEFGDDDRRMTLEHVVFADDATHLRLSCALPAQSSQSESGSPRCLVSRGGTTGGDTTMPPRDLIVRDDEDTSTPARRMHAGSDGRSWSGGFTTHVPLSSTTAWIEIDGVRLQLPENGQGLQARIETIEAAEPIRAMLYHESLLSVHSHGIDGSLDDAVKALVATGTLESDDPRVLDARRIGAAIADEVATPDLPQPWAKLTLRMQKSDGPVGRLAIGVVVGSLEGCSIRFDVLRSLERSFSVDSAGSPGFALMNRPGSLKPSPVEWWAEDDCENVYLMGPAKGGASRQTFTGTIRSLSPLDPAAHELRLLPTGVHERAVVTIPLASLREGH